MTPDNCKKKSKKNNAKHKVDKTGSQKTNK